MSLEDRQKEAGAAEEPVKAEIQEVSAAEISGETKAAGKAQDAGAGGAFTESGGDAPAPVGADGLLSDSAFTKRRKFIVDIIYLVIIIGLSVLFVRYALPALVSFIIAFLVTLILRPILRFFTDKCGFNRRTMSLIIVLLFYATIGVAAFFLFASIVNWGSSVVSRIPEFYRTSIAPGLSSALDKVGDLIEEIGSKFNMPDIHIIPTETTDAATEAITTAVDAASDAVTAAAETLPATPGAESAGFSFDLDGAISTFLTNIYSTLANMSANILKSTPKLALSASGALIKVIICIISTAFLLTDFDLVSNFIHKQLSPKASEKLNAVSKHLGKVLKKYILSYALIMLITFAEICVGLLIIRVDRAPLIAAIIAVFDILPIVGSGMVLLPWAIITLILGNIGRGIGLLILWAVVVIVRQIIEPKIVGNHVGLHPLVTLFAMIAGNFIYGGIGILLLPVALALIQSLNEDGVIRIYRPLKRDEIPEEKEGRLARAVKKPVGKVLHNIRRLRSRTASDVRKIKKKSMKKNAGKEEQGQDGQPAGEEKTAGGGTEDRPGGEM
ncbi:MAG: AI-2E family transporter [Clostridia bacterium]|nr:AI-2E family transporter [Clostridia bacterium]MBP5173937.1 AI-2E family transporter [Clostridia bacterium]